MKKIKFFCTLWLLFIVVVSCDNKNNTHDSIPDENYEVIIDTLPVPELAVIRKNIRERGDFKSMMAYSAYYDEDYYYKDRDSIIYYLRLMVDKYSYDEAYYYMFRYWRGKYNRSRKAAGFLDTTFIDSAMACLLVGSEKGDYSSNYTLAYLYANGIYFEQDTSKSNECLRKAGYSEIYDVIGIRKNFERIYRANNIDWFMDKRDNCIYNI